LNDVVEAYKFRWHYLIQPSELWMVLACVLVGTMVELMQECTVIVATTGFIVAYK
jgi:hypothetical protein